MTRDNSTPAEWMREISMTEAEETVLVKMGEYFMDMGWIDDDTEKAFDSLRENLRTRTVGLFNRPAIH